MKKHGYGIHLSETNYNTITNKFNHAALGLIEMDGNRLVWQQDVLRLNEYSLNVTDARPEPIMFFKLPILCFLAMVQISPYYGPNMLHCHQICSIMLHKLILPKLFCC